LLFFIAYSVLGCHEQVIVKSPTLCVVWSFLFFIIALFVAFKHLFLLKAILSFTTRLFSIERVARHAMVGILHFLWSKLLMLLFLKVSKYFNLT